MGPKKLWRKIEGFYDSFPCFTNPNSFMHQLLSDIYVSLESRKWGLNDSVLYEFDGIDRRKNKCVVAKQPDCYSCSVVSLLRIAFLAWEEGHDLKDKKLVEFLKENNLKAVEYVKEKTNTHGIGTRTLSLIEYIHDLFPFSETRVYIPLIEKKVEKEDKKDIKKVIEEMEEEDKRLFKKLLDLSERGVEFNFEKDAILTEGISYGYTFWSYSIPGNRRHANSSDPFLNHNFDGFYSSDPNGGIYRYKSENDFKNKIKPFLNYFIVIKA